MSAHRPTARFLGRFPRLAVLLYGALVAVGFLTAAIAAVEIAERYRALDASSEMLARLQGRADSPASSSANAAPKASAFLPGSTITVASAGLLQRVAAVITAAGGTISSSEVEPQNAQGKDGHVKVTVSCELDQSKVQQLLYEIEAGMPFLFIEQLVAQGPLPENPKMRLVIEVSGVWAGAR
jgi:general secretion pathway protein M